ncbi:MAG: alpha/beta fold hydrolase [Burkholderiaceae bacterium]
MQASRSEYIPIRKLQYHVRHWGRQGDPLLIMLHGWMDMSASFQFVVDQLKRPWHVIAPDWRGFGLTDPLPGDTSWFPDYLADLEAILRHYSPGQPARIVGHSMGGNIAMVYAGVRPQGIAGLVNLEGVGLPSAEAHQAPGRYAQWLDELLDPPVLRAYTSKTGVIERLQKNNPRLSRERAEFLAGHWARQNESGKWEILADPKHKKVNPVLYRIDEITACWGRIAAPVLWIEAEDSISTRWPGPPLATRTEIERRIRHIPKVEVALVQNASHMVHHDQPEEIARRIEKFFA